MAEALSRAVCAVAGGAMEAALRRFPPVVRIETTNACNAHCTICPHRAMQRPLREMDDGLFALVVDECARSGCREIHLHNFGEPLLDPRLAERIRYAKHRGLRRVKIFTNGSLLDEGWARRLIAAGLDEIKISFDGGTRDEFERIRVPLRFDRVLENVCRLVTLRNAMRSALHVRAVCSAAADRRETARILLPVVDSLVFGRVHNWAGTEPLGPRRAVRKPCSRLWRTLTVLAGGEVALCCLDYDGRHLLGRIDAATSLAAVWHSAAYAEVRRRHAAARQDELPLCRGCSKALV
jgi:pyruvate-formate lyase-activating enzyme